MLAVRRSREYRFTVVCKYKYFDDKFIDLQVKIDFSFCLALLFFYLFDYRSLFTSYRLVIHLSLIKTVVDKAQLQYLIQHCGQSVIVPTMSCSDVSERKSVKGQMFQQVVQKVKNLRICVYPSTPNHAV